MRILPRKIGSIFWYVVIVQGCHGELRGLLLTLLDRMFVIKLLQRSRGMLLLLHVYYGDWDADGCLAQKMQWLL